MIESLQALHWDEWAATIFGLLYIFFATRAEKISWFFGIFGSLLWAYGTYVHYNLFFDMSLNIFYVFVSIYGLYQWSYGKGGKEREINEWEVSTHVMIITVCVAFSLAMAYLIRNTGLIEADYPYLDAFTTVFSIAATFLLAYKIRSNWLYWVLIDSTYIYLYSLKEAWLYLFLFVIYTLMAVYGFFSWQNVHDTKD